MTAVSQPKEMQTTDDIGIPPLPSNSAHNYKLCDITLIMMTWTLNWETDKFKQKNKMQTDLQSVSDKPYLRVSSQDRTQKPKRRRSGPRGWQTWPQGSALASEVGNVGELDHISFIRSTQSQYFYVKILKSNKGKKLRRRSGPDDDRDGLEAVHWPQNAVALAPTNNHHQLSARHSEEAWTHIKIQYWQLNN